MENMATTRMSSKGQVVTPEAVRTRLGLKTGSQLVVIGDRDVVILRTITTPAREECAALAAKARGQARAAGVRRSDVAPMVRKARRRVR